VDAATQGIHRDFVERILAVIRPVQTSRSGIGEQAIHTYSHESGEQLSDRELEILRLMACGATNQAIAEQLFITVGTVKSHVNHILRVCMQNSK
jgi:DNA-binding NarL/FixJ family response regulator